MVIVDLAAATICFLGSCHPMLYGNDTPIGEFEITQRITQTAGYGGDVLQFYETADGVYSIHRLWKLNPKQHRELRIKSLNPKDHLITNGCINVEPEVYEELVDCCSNDKLLIKR